MKTDQMSTPSLAQLLPEFGPGLVPSTKDTLYYQQPGYREHKAGTKSVSIRQAVRFDGPVYVVSMTFKTGEGSGTSGTGGEFFTNLEAAAAHARELADLDGDVVPHTFLEHRIKATLLESLRASGVNTESLPVDDMINQAVALSFTDTDDAIPELMEEYSKLVPHEAASEAVCAVVMVLPAAIEY